MSSTVLRVRLVGGGQVRTRRFRVDTLSCARVLAAQASAERVDYGRELARARPDRAAPRERAKRGAIRSR